MESQQNLLDSRADIEFLPLQSEEDLDDLKNDDENENVSPLEMDEEAYDPTRNESLTPFQQMPEVKRRNAFKVSHRAFTKNLNKTRLYNLNI